MLLVRDGHGEVVTGVAMMLIGQNSRVVAQRIGVEYVKKSKLELVIPDHLVEAVVRTIREKAHTGNPGDGKIFVYTVDDVVRIRTGEHGESSI